MSHAETTKSPITANLTGEDGEFYYTTHLSTPNGCEHRIGFAFNTSLSTDVITTSRLYVPERFQRHGLATKLLMAGFALAQSNAVLTSMSHISSPYALMARRSIFGSENIIICDDDRDATPLGIDVEDAIEALRNDEQECGFVVVSSLVELDTTGSEPVLVP